MKVEAQDAKFLLDNPLLQKVFKEVEDELFEGALALPARDSEGRDIMLFQVRALRIVKNTIYARITQHTDDERKAPVIA